MQTCNWSKGMEIFHGYTASAGPEGICAEVFFLFPNQMLKERKSNNCPWSDGLAL